MLAKAIIAAGRTMFVREELAKWGRVVPSGFWGGVMLSGLMICSPAQAQEAPTDYVGSSHVWELSCNKHGYQLKTKYPMSWYDRAYRYQEKRVTLYLGDSCDASSPSFGKGKWNWANGGFVAELDGRRFGFARQELICGTKKLPDTCRF